MKKSNLKWLILILAGLITRFLFLGIRPLEGDEGIVLKIASSADLKSLFNAVSHDVHPPLFHFLQFITLKLWPLSEYSARVVSAIAGFVAIYFIYKVFEKISNQKVAFWVALLSIFNPVLTYHFAEARPYGVLVMLIFAQLFVFLQLIESKKKRHLFGFFALSTLLVLTQYISFVFLFGELAYLILLKRKMITWQKVVSGLLAIAMFGALWGKVFISQVQGRSLEQSQALNIKDNLIGVFNGIYRFFAGRLFLDLDPSISRNLSFAKDNPVLFIVFILSIVIPLGLLVWGIIDLKKRNKDNLYLLLIIFTPSILAALLSSEIGPRAVRYLLFLVPVCLYIIVELYFSKKTLAKNIVFSAFMVIYLGAFVSGFYFERTKPGVNAIATYLLRNADPGDKVVVRGGFGGGERFVLKYYLGDESGVEIFDLYGDYQVGNLDKIKSRDSFKYIKNIKALDNKKNVWFYDMTYNFDETTIVGNFEKFGLGKDKENKELMLYKF